MLSNAKSSFECFFSKGQLGHFMEFQEGRCPLGHPFATCLVLTESQRLQNEMFISAIKGYVTSIGQVKQGYVIH